MKTITVETSMKCQSCLSKVEPVLESDTSIHDWTADLADPRKPITLTVADDVDAEHVVRLVNSVGIDATPASTTADAVAQTSEDRKPSSEEDSFRLSNYRPLLLVVAYVVGGTVFAESLLPGWNWSRAMTWFMGFFFVAFAFFKLLDISKFADAFSTYDIVAKRSRVYGLSYPWIELSLGIVFLSQHLLLIAAIVTLIVMAVGLVGVISAVRRKQQIQCACLGTVFNLPMSAVTIVENSVMIIMSAVMIWTALVG
ncbi:MauE/DoxX family redox-associated membrane protein [Fuerstiella marisgermanici]|uniref:Methylamine utilisation protein MauE domain-containing protein n=1 Tax=Fuerstiella marisgermanici TaxID=1891926 RepID=A0A1P8WQY2_9PLAN|nr:MauE/DoxX family redox-associated membrane protein [Fuerstiella marisgermanici]APZ96449.1 hypothetical protein Fuma_06118 [Fuerstiella marisgermanici]